MYNNVRDNVIKPGSKLNIKSHSAFIASHPYTKQAFTKHLEGDSHDLEHLLFEIQIHMYLQCCTVADRTYRRWKDLQPAEIRRELKDMPAPESLSINLPMVLLDKPKLTLSKPIAIIKKMYHSPKPIPNQLKLWDEVA